jgi:Zn-dependent protease
LQIRITPGALLFFIALAITGASSFLSTALCVAVHECAHLATAKLMRVRVRTLELDIGGAQIKTAGLFPSYRAEWLIAAAGPAASLLLALLLAPVPSVFAKTAMLTSLSFALFNLLPIEGFDGGRILFATSATLFSETVAARTLYVTTYLVLLFLFSIAACLLLRYGRNATLIALCASLFTKLFLLGQTGSNHF